MTAGGYDGAFFRSTTRARPDRLGSPSTGLPPSHPANPCLRYETRAGARRRLNPAAAAHRERGAIRRAMPWAQMWSLGED